MADVECDECAASGDQPCSTCDGDGCTDCDYSGEEECDWCDGSGYIDDDE